MPKPNACYAPDIRGNVLLASLPQSDAWLLTPHLSRLHFGARDCVSRTACGSVQLIFPETAVFCVRQALLGDRQPALGLVGHEGLLGWSLLMGVEESFTLATVELQGGTALSIAARPLLDACGKSPTLRAHLLRYADNFLEQMASMLGSNTIDALERRVARWILMLHDRSDGDTLYLTHDEVARALHTRRASVTDCFHVLEGEKILRCERARLTICDRDRLMALAGCSYGAAEARYATEIAPWPRAGRLGDLSADHVCRAQPVLVP
ncbi:Crp/Fnr family transcriptional regulator [Sphingomonas sp.]|uniref:Crp/Fnr family transcriptional regulator n=1 Tax=Sphingomonas sp. TaxID=28214 RepID=UPI0028B22C9D|nr:Crp/Fnr family transcriptional regulator [Sphingomonas sp.]